MPKKDHIAHEVVHYYEGFHRDFAWRESRTPYRVFLSEVLLQRTRAEQAEPVFMELAERYPNVAALYQDIEKVAKVIGGLGRLCRVGPLKRGLSYLITNYGGEFPLQNAKLIKVPSIGLYAAAAVRVFGFGVRDTIVDSNVVRVFGRLYGLQTTPETRRSRDFMELVEPHVPVSNFAEYSYGLLDFASAVCTPLSPKCEGCSLRYQCDSAKESPEKVAVT